MKARLAAILGFALASSMSDPLRFAPVPGARETILVDRSSLPVPEQQPVNPNAFERNLSRRKRKLEKKKRARAGGRK